MTTITVVDEYHGGKGFVTTEQVRVTEGSLRGPVSFHAPGVPVPKGFQVKLDRAAAGWQRVVQDAARQVRLTHGEVGAFVPVSVVLQFASDVTGGPARTDLLCRAVLDALVHARLLHDDSGVVDLVATRRPVSLSPSGGPGVWVTVFPFPIFGSGLSAVASGACGSGAVSFTVEAVPRVLGDGREGLRHGTTNKWLDAVRGVAPTVVGPCTLISSFGLARWLEPAGVDYPIVNGRDVDKLTRAVAHAGGFDVTDFVSSKRITEPPGGVFTVASGALLTQKVLGSVFRDAGQSHQSPAGV
jgi:Holliday junction resolvase RusA-like endonuclease